MKKRKAKRSTSKWFSAKFYFRHWFIVLSVLLALIAALMVFWSLGIRSGVRAPVSFEISQGATVGGVAASLEKRGWVNSADTFKVLVRLHGGRVQAGLYDIPRGASQWRIAKMFANGHIASTVIVIPEGFTVRQIVSLLNENGFLTGDACPSACPKEGELFPDTYNVPKGVHRAAVVKLMSDKMQEIKRKWEISGRRLPRPLKSWDEVIILASLVEKETPKASEMPLVASVYLNRLRSNMRLQADPTVVYAITDRLGDMQGAPLLTVHLQIDHPFNTYKNHGLTPGPIANPGWAAITAVLNPADTNYLFFVADGNGGHNFSNDYESHKANREIWREIKSKKN